MKLTRRDAMTALSSGALLAVLPTGAFAARETDSRQRLDFQVLRDGSEIGYHRLDIHHQGGRTTVDIDINLEVGIGPLVLYRYAHRNREVWEDGKLLRFESRTDDDGQEYRVTARRRDRYIAVDREPAADYRLDREDVLPTTYWRPETVEQTLLLDTQEGRPMQVEVDDLGWDEIVAGGRKLRARKYAMQGDLTTTIWYDESGRWVKLAFPLKGSTFDYVMR